MRSITGYPNPARRWAPPEELAGHILRPRLVERLAGEERVALVSAPPGYGKTQAARQWFAVEERPVAWFALDMVSDNPMSFWTRLVANVRGVIPSIDDEPALLLAERGPSDLAFLDELAAQVDWGGSPAAVVIDDVRNVRDRSIFDGLAHLVDHAGHRLRFVIVCRSDPPLPLARWRSVGWLAEVREEQLRFTDDEAIAFASTFGNRVVSDDAAIALNTRVEGWPIGVHLALLSAADTPEPDSTVQTVVDSDRLLGDYLVAEVLDRLPATERDVALALSVFDWFDAGLCADLLGVSAVPIAYELYRRRLFLTMLDETHGAMRFHHLFRELLEIELRWREPERYVMLHRAAAALWRVRGDLNAAYRHLLKVDDLAAACDLVAPLAIDLVDRGRRGDLRNHLRSLPASLNVDDATQAFDLAMAWSFAGDELEAMRWCDRGERLMSSGAPRDRIRNHAIRSFLSLMQGRIGVASTHVIDLERVGVNPAAPIERHFVTLGARVALSAGRFEDARRWVDQARTFGDPAILASVVVPSLDAWLELETGDLRRATRLAADARTSADRLGVRPHHGATEALIVEAWCLVASGHLRDASYLAELARLDADELGWLWHRVRVGLLTAEIHRLRFGPASALDEIDHVRTGCAAASVGDVDPLLDAAEATALIASGRYEAAVRVLDRLPDSPRTRLIRARLSVSSPGGDTADTLLADRDDWTLPERLEADVLIAATMRPGRAAERSMTSALEVGHDSGWVSPFLGHGGAVDRLLRRLPLERVHPALSRVLRMPQVATDRTRTQLLEPLTPREKSLLDLLPTHLSYAEIGKRLFLSVNTVKTNLKAMYRKLDVTSRAGAVDAAAALDLLSDHHYGGHVVDG